MAEYIKAEDLRLGNLLYDRTFGFDHVSTVTSIYSKDGGFIGVDRANFAHNIKQFAGISLTEEWLEKFGIKEGGFDLPSMGFLWVEHYANTCCLCIQAAADSCNTIRIEVKWVHSLQNIIHALTGQELTIKQTA